MCAPQTVKGRAMLMNLSSNLAPLYFSPEFVTKQNSFIYKLDKEIAAPGLGPILVPPHVVWLYGSMNLYLKTKIIP
jgi:hypothetical protein